MIPNNKIDDFVSDAIYPDGMSDIEINDIFWFEEDLIAEVLGYNDFEELMNDREDAE